MEKTQQQKLREFFLLNAGTLLVSIGVYFFKMPNNFSTGGVTGIAIVISKFIPGVSTGTLVFLFNMILLAVGFLVLSRKFGFATVYSSTLMSVVIWVLERLYPMEAPFTNEPLLELIFAVGLPALGSAILFNIGASTGGTDIVAMVLRKYTSIDIGRALLMADFLVAFSACFVFGIHTGLFSILGLLMKSLMVDLVLENINIHKYFHIITTKPREIERFITETLHRSATEMDAQGAYTHESRKVLLTVVNRRQAVVLRKFVRQTDPSAFVLIMNTGDIIGKGFRGLN